MVPLSLLVRNKSAQGLGPKNMEKAAYAIARRLSSPDIPKIPRSRNACDGTPPAVQNYHQRRQFCQIVPWL
jgi:hypothetical protein